MELEEDVDEKENQNGEELLPEKTKPKNKNSQYSTNELDNLKEEEEDCDEEPIDIDGEVVPTYTVERGMDTMFHTADLKDDNDDDTSIDKKDHTEYIRNQFDKYLEVSFY